MRPAPNANRCGAVRKRAAAGSAAWSAAEAAVISCFVRPMDDDGSSESGDAESRMEEADARYAVRSAFGDARWAVGQAKYASREGHAGRAAQMEEETMHDRWVGGALLRELT
jgi:hypothetical protein